MLRSTNKIALTLILLVGVCFSLVATHNASAVTGSDWNPGNIIDDAVYFNANEMSTNDIQNFLNAQMPSCDTWGNQPYGGTTRAAYGASRGYPAPYTCLKDYVENPTTHQNNANGGSVSGGWSAAQIIKHAADTYSINPKVLIVLLQKEQSLVTDDWPWTIQYRSATGYGCPDTAPCDAEYYGFYNQVEKAAYQFRRYATYPSEYRYKAFQSNYIQYNPNAGCGGTDVYIVNQATAGLYNYTPYQPNPSALANLYGLGDGCGAYGNRNFWRMYSDWFGSTRMQNLPPIASSAGSPITMAPQGDDRLSVFGINNADMIYHKTQTAANSSSWGSWTQIEGGLRNISSSINADRRIQLFGIAGSGSVYSKTQTAANSSSWGSWNKIEGWLSTSSQTLNQDGRLSLFGVNAGGSIYYKTQTAANSSSWGSWTQMEGILKNISAHTNADGRIQLFGVNPHGDIYYKNQTAANSSTWSSWVKMPGWLETVAIGRNADGRLVVFGTNGIGSIYYNTQTAANSSTWDGWTQIDGGLRHITAGSHADGRIQLFGINQNGDIYYKNQTAANSSTWSSWVKMEGGLRRH